MFSDIAQKPKKDTFYMATCFMVMLVLFLGPVFFSLWPFWSLNYGKELLFQFLAMMLVTFFIAGAIARGSWRSDLTSLGKPLRLPLLLMLASLVLATVLGGAPFEARMTFLDVILGFLFAVILAQALRERAIKPVPVLLVVILGGVLNAGMAISQSFGWDLIFGIPMEEVGESMVSGRRKVMGFLGNPVFVSEYMSASVPFVLALLLIGKSRLRKIVMGIVLAVLVVGVLVTMTRAPAISTIVGFGVFSGLLAIIAKGTPHLRKQKEIVGLVLLAIVLIYVGAFVKYSGVLERYSERASFDRRLSMWSNTKAMIEESPVLGNGLGAFKYLYLDSQVQGNLNQMQGSRPGEIRVSPKGGLAHAHNEYIQIAAEMGAVGLFCLIFFVVSVFGLGITSLRRTLKNRRNTSTDDNCIIVVSALTSGAITLTNGLSGFPFHIAPTATLGLTAVALVMGLSMRMRDSTPTRQQNDRPVTARAMSRRLIPALLVLAIFAGAIWALMTPIKAFIADYHGYVGDRLRKAGATERALGRYGFAASLQPDDGRLLFKMGLCMSTMGKLEPARTLYGRSRRNYNVPVLLVSSSENSLRLGYVFEAIRGFTRAHAYTQMDRFNQRLSKIYSKLGQRFAEQRRFDVALGCLEEARALAPSVQVLKLIVDVQEQRGTMSDAARTLTDVLEMDEFEIEAAFKLGEYYETQKELLRAREFFEKVRRLDPDFRRVGDRILTLSLELSNKADVPVWERGKDLYLMGKLALNYGQHEQASEMFDNAGKMGVNAPQAHFFTGESLEKRGMLAEAEREYRLAFSLDPHDARPLVNLQRLFEARNDDEGVEWIRDRIRNFTPEYELEKSFALAGPGSHAPFSSADVHEEVLRGISIDELSIQWEKDVALTIVWDSLPLTGVGQDSVESLQAVGSQILRYGRRFVLVKNVTNLIGGKGAFTLREGGPQLIEPGSVSCPTSRPQTHILKTSNRVLRAVSYSKRLPVDPDSEYILFYKIWASGPGAYMGKEFYDQSGHALLFNRNRSNGRVGEWEYFIDYFVPPKEARSVVLFLVLEQADAGAWFDQIVLAPIPRVTNIRMQRNVRGAAQ